MAQFKSGDVLAFCGRGKESNIVRLRDLTRISHVGVVCYYGGKMFLWESTTLSNIECAWCNKSHHGVQAVDIRTRIKNYEGKIWVAKLREPIAPNRLLDGSKFMAQQHGKGYDRKQVYWAIPSLGIYPWQRYDDSAWFCSELVIAFLQRVDRVDNNTSPATWRPAHVIRRLTRWGILEPIELVKR